MKIEEMPIIITYSDKKVDKEKLYRLFYNIIDKDLNKTEMEVKSNEKKCMSYES